jgi:hypothetical protein
VESRTKENSIVAGIGVSFITSSSLVTVLSNVTVPKLRLGGTKHTEGPWPLQIT